MISHRSSLLLLSADSFVRCGCNYCFTVDLVHQSLEASIQTLRNQVANYGTHYNRSDRNRHLAYASLKLSRTHLFLNLVKHCMSPFMNDWFHYSSCKFCDKVASL